MAPITIGIAGATGFLGGYLSRALLSPQFYPSQIGKVVGYTRNPSSEQAQALKATGVEVRASSADPEAYKGLDVFINAASIRSPEDWAVMDSHVKAAIDGGIKVFFPSEFGMDHYTKKNDLAHAVLKKAKGDLAVSYSGGKVKVVRICTSNFLNYGHVGFAVKMGYDHYGGKYEILGDANVPITFTHLDDIGRSVARLAILAVNEPNTVPEVVRVAGTSANAYKIADLVGAKIGKKIEVTSVDPATFPTPGPRDFVLMLRKWWGSGNADFSKDNENEIINPGEKFWKWISIENWMDQRDGNFPIGSVDAPPDSSLNFS